MAQASAEKLEHTGPAGKERLASVPQRESSLQVRWSPPYQRKRNRAVCPEHQIMRGKRVKVGASRTLARAWRGKGGLHGEGRQIPMRKGRASKESLPRRGKRKHERVSGHKSSPGRSTQSWFHSKSGQN